jgi:BTB/POZ domain
MSETSTNKVVLEDFDADAVRKTLLYCYTGEVLLQDCDLEHVFVVADFLGIQDLALECEEVRHNARLIMQL